MPKFHSGIASTMWSAAWKGAAMRRTSSQAVCWASLNGTPLMPAYLASSMSCDSSGSCMVQGFSVVTWQAGWMRVTSSMKAPATSMLAERVFLGEVSM
ncbi:hypothetical protein FQZ97_1136300 [compost metagenome]